jgi:uncharacterized Zn finger protein
MVTNAGGSSAVQAGDTIQVETEQMRVTAVSGSGPWALTVTRGYGGTTEVPHTPGKVVYQVVASTTVQVTNTGGTSAVQPGHTIQVDGENMYVTAVGSGAASVYNLTVTRGYDGTTAAAHALAAAVTRVSYPDRTITVTNTGGSAAVQNGDVIEVDTEKMRVTGVSGSGPWTLTVTRGFGGTTEAAHTSGKVVYKVVGDSTVQVTNTGATSSVQSGDTIQVDGENMLVTGVTAGAATVYNLTVTRAYYHTTRAAHALNAAVKKVTFPDLTVQVTNTGGSSAVQNGDTIQVDNEKMLVTGVSLASAGVWNLAVTRAYSFTNEVAHTAGTTVYRLTTEGSAHSPTLHVISDSGEDDLPDYGAAGGTFTFYGGLCIGVPRGASCNNATCVSADSATLTGTAYTGSPTGTIAASGNDLTVTGGGGTDILEGDYVLIGTEKLKVTAVVDDTHLTVTRGEFGTPVAAHSAVAVKYLIGSPEVTLADGVYIMAGGGFRVCGAATVHAPHVLIVNTTDTDPVTGVTPAGGTLDQIQINTIGDVTLGAPTGGAYAGLSIYQPVTDAMSTFSTASFATPQHLAAAMDATQTTMHTDGTAIADSTLISVGGEVMRVGNPGGGGTSDLTVERAGTLTPGSDEQVAHPSGTEIKRVTGSKCDGRSTALTDILFSRIGTNPAAGLEGITGSIYAPNPYSLFTDAVSGTADIAVMTGCLFINGAAATFTFDPANHVGTSTVTFVGQWG